MNTWLRFWMLFVLAVPHTRLLAQDEALKAFGAPRVISSTFGVKLEAVKEELKEAFDLVPKVSVEEQNLYLEKGLSAIFHYGNMLSVAEMKVDALITMEEMFALIPEGSKKELVGDRMASAYRSARDSIMLPHFVGIDFENAGKLKDDEALRETVGRMRHIHDAFQAIFVERTAMITKADRRELEKMAEEIKRTYEEARKGQQAKK